MKYEDLTSFVKRRIHIRMNALEIDQRELARRLGISEVVLCRYVTGKRKIPHDTLIRIAQALECEPGYLINIHDRLE